MRIDYIEIGTCDFDTLISDENNGIGISIEPLKYYLDKLPDREGCIKINKAISNKKDTLNIYYVTEENINKYNLPHWVKGCNSVNYKHPTVVDLLNTRNISLNIIQKETVECISIKDVIEEYGIEYFNTLKIDTEGHDLVIMRDFHKLNMFPENIIFESNDLTNQEELKSILELYNNYKIVAKIGDEVHLRKIDTKPRVAIFMRTIWALGRIHTDLIGFLKNEYEFVWFDWTKSSEVSKLFMTDLWKTFDIILSNTQLVNGYLENCNIPLYDNIEFLKKLFIISHCPFFSYQYYEESIYLNNPLYLKYPTYGGVSKETVKNLRTVYNVDALYTPCGVNLNNFPKIFKPEGILNLGYIGSPTYPSNSPKNPDVFKEICMKTQLNPIYIFGKNFTEHYKLYEGIDILICTSLFEAGPLGIFEAISCGIPAISTPVGNVVELKSIKTFKTVEEAISIIEYFRQNKEKFDTYRENLTREVREKWNCNLLFHKYWKSFLSRSTNRTSF